MGNPASRPKCRATTQRGDAEDLFPLDLVAVSSAQAHGRGQAAPQAVSLSRLALIVGIQEENANGSCRRAQRAQVRGTAEELTD